MPVNYSTAMTLNLLCFIKRSKVDASQNVPLYLRISVNGERAEISLKRFVDPKQWDSKKQQMKGRSEQSKVVNDYIQTMKLSLYGKYNSMIAKGDALTASNLKKAFFGKEEKGKTIMEVFEYHNQKMKQSIGIGYSKSTHKRYKTTYTHLSNYLQWKFKTKDNPLTCLNYEFVTDLEFYLRTEKQCCNNSALKYINNFKKVVNMARKLGWVTNDPFMGFKSKFEAVDRGYLTEEEVMSIAGKSFSIERLNVVKDIFLFCCFTGLAYVDVERLSAEHIVTGIDGNKWITIERTKTGVPSKIPLLPVPESLIEKYKSNVYCQRNNKLLPVFSNQKINAYLKEIADVCGIKKHLTFHVSRHTFATSITLANKVPLESVSKMLGHKSIRTTQIYSRVVDKKLSEDISYLKMKYSGKDETTSPLKVINL
jgi:integrase